MGAQPAFVEVVQPVAQPAPIPVARPQLPTAEQILPYLQAIDAGRWYANFGPLVQRLEARLAERLGPRAGVVTTCNGTSALSLALQAAAAPGGLCVMPSWTFAATPHAALRAGLTPWFFDVDPETWMLDPESVLAALRHAPWKVSAVVPVAAYGRLPDLKAWAEFRKITGVPVVLDAAAAFDTLERAPIPAAVSLHATKVLGVGEGGYLAAEDQELLDRVRELSSFGFRGSRDAQVCAANAKLSEYAAAVGHASLDAWPLARRRFMVAAQHLKIAMIDTPRARFQPGWGVDWISSVCVLGLPEGAAGPVAESLAERGVDTRRWWSRGCHAMPAFAGLPSRPLPVTAALADSTLGVPFSINLEADEVARIADALTGALAAL